MNFVKWIRKNTSKIMVFVIIFAMLSFVVGQFGLKMIVSLMGGGNNQLIATFVDGKKIKTQDYIQAQNELKILKMLLADQLLVAQSQRGISGPLLSYLLFPESQFAGNIPSMMKQAVQRGQVRITMQELDDYFLQNRENPGVLWILLRAEAYRTGMITPNSSAAEILRSAIPMLTNNQYDAERYVSLIIENNNISKDQILRVFADLLSVMTYADSIMDNQSVTINQIKGTIGRSLEQIDADYVEISADQFVDPNTDISDAKIQEQFEAYKSVAPDISTQDNPLGFGYKLGKKMQIEYMLVNMDDVKEQIVESTPEELEAYYDKNIGRFMQQVPSDPNNPESEKIQKTLSFAEVEGQIRRFLESEKTDTLANILFNEIKDNTEVGFETLNVDDATVNELQAAAADFQAIAKTVGDKHQIPVISGKTGWLSAEMLANDDIIKSLTIRRGQNRLPLMDLAMSVTEEKSQRRQIGVPAMRTWQNIGPLQGGFYSQEEMKYYSVMALVRVVGVQQPRVADSLDVEFKTQGMVLDEDKPQEDSHFSLKETVKQDLLLVMAMDTAKQRAEELSALVSEKGWDDGLTAYNDRYAPAPAEPNKTNPDALTLSSIEQQLRMPKSGIEMTKRFMVDNPGFAKTLQQRLVGYLLTNKLYDLLPPQAESTEELHTVIPFEPLSACLVVKQVKRQSVTLNDYMEGKANTALQLSSTQAANLALGHFNSDNILKRMNLEFAKKDEPQEAEPQTPTQDQDSKSE